MTKRIGFIALGLACLAAASAQAQPAEFGVSVGLKAWNTQWTTFGYTGNGELKQVPAEDKTVLVPLLSVRYRDFIGSISGYGSTDYTFIEGGGDSRKELDANVGYFVAPGVAVTLGYKKVGQKQREGSGNYELSGPVAGLSATATLREALALYGAFGFGKLKPTGASNVDLDADYRLTELGLAYTWPTDRWLVKALTFTLGYRTQVFSSKQALDTTGQDGRDLTQGFTFGLVASF